MEGSTEEITEGGSYQDRLRALARERVEVSSVQDLEAFVGGGSVDRLKIEMFSIDDTIKGLEESDLSITNWIVELPIGVVVNLLRYLSPTDAVKLCRLNKVFEKWCERVGFVDELERIRQEGLDKLRERAKKLAFIFTTTRVVTMTIFKKDEMGLVHRLKLDDESGDRVFLIKGVREREGVGEIFGMFPVVDDLNALRDDGEMAWIVEPSRWVFSTDQEEQIEREGVAHSWIALERYPDVPLVVTEVTMGVFEDFFYKILSGGWDVENAVDLSMDEFGTPLDIGCQTCGSNEGMSRCSKCKGPDLYCGLFCQMVHWPIHKNECVEKIHR